MLYVTSVKSVNQKSNKGDMLWVSILSKFLGIRFQTFNFQDIFRSNFQFLISIWVLLNLVHHGHFRIVCMFNIVLSLFPSRSRVPFLGGDNASDIRITILWYLELVAVDDEIGYLIKCTL